MTTGEPVQAAERPLAATRDSGLTETLARALDGIEALMHDVVKTDVTILRDASRHILDAGGKRLRPRLLLLSYAACGGTDMAEVLPVAAAIELMHTASVVHDDINDHGVVRRGRPSVNAIWGRTFALLTGDYLFTKVYELMAPFKDMNIILAEAAVALVEGETLQASAVKENRFTRETYYDIIGRKTAALFRAAGQIGAELAGARSEEVRAVANYAYNVGLAFQIIDDILDLTATTERIGKTAGIDLAQGKGYAAAHNGNGEASDGQVAPTSADPMETIKRKLLRGDAIEEGRAQARMLARLAVDELAALPDSEAKEHLIDLADLVVNRDY